MSFFERIGPRLGVTDALWKKVRDGDVPVRVAVELVRRIPGRVRLEPRTL